MTVYGACVGSFLNVVIYRLPEGISLVHPPSRCPKCDKKLAWYDNVPVLGWLWLRGKCRYCHEPISPQYPLIEALCAVMFAGMYWVDYQSGLRPSFAALGLFETWPALVVQLTLIAGLLAATMIDARLFIIPLQIPYTLLAVTLVVLPVSTIWFQQIDQVTATVGPGAAGASAGAVVGLIMAIVLLRLKVLPLSFADEDEIAVEEMADDAVFPPHPHPRREVLKEVLFVAVPCVGALVGCTALKPAFQGNGWAAGPWVTVLAGAVWGYLVGGALVWGTRIFGTLTFGKEAMGLGDVHLLGAIGAVLGWQDTVAVFFVAPFLGLIGAALVLGIDKLVKGRGRVIPYGPYLAGAAVIVMVFREPLLEIYGNLYG